ncbi:MAG: gluconate 2-dehydrogenase subunit 3 family protein [Pseudolabrys sp.]
MPLILNRRHLLSTGVMAGAAAALHSHTGEAHEISGEVPWQPGDANTPDFARGGGYQFLSSAEVAFLDAAVARLIPADELGPGAKEAGATDFIDRQLAGSYGQATHWYMQGPWANGEKTQGYQSRMSPAELYRTAIKAVDDHCRSALKGREFAALSSNEQDQVLSGLEKNEIKLTDVDAQTFFDVLLQNTIEGYFSDPLYGGNRDMVGWKLIGFPGARYDYRPYVGKHNEKLAFDPVGITGRPGWNPAKS